jgi:8-oxo-dGTP pyrophosphatase MutT (NUDIX family)
MAETERAVISRRVVRIAVESDDGQLLLLEDSDLGLEPPRHWWIPPGGGVESGETDLVAAMRELKEETGLQVSGAELVGPVSRRFVIHGYSEYVESQHEYYYVAKVRAFEPDTTGLTVKERSTIRTIAWTAPTMIARGDIEVWPRNLLEIVALASDPDVWQQGPVDFGSAEESTVPA